LLEARAAVTALLELRDVRKTFHTSGTSVRAVDGIDLTIGTGETLGLVGESGCGKSTTAKLVLRLLEPTSGTILFNGEPVETLKGRALRPFRSAVQAVFQNPYSALDPRMRVRNIVAEPLVAAGGYSASEIRERVAEQLSVVGLRSDAGDRFPHEFSGGQRQRIAIARALILLPKLLVLDEPVSALDVSIRAQVLNLLLDLQDRFGLSYLLISHDLPMVARMCDQIAVMYLGRIVEYGPAAAVAARPQHPYAQALFAAILLPDPDAPPAPVRLQGDVPSPLEVPAGCRFHTRCPIAHERCSIDEPLLAHHGAPQRAACHYAAEPAEAPVATASKGDR
jgi:oligopeptide transport system ATP-binding protein